MEWLDQLKVGGPLAVVLGAGLVALWQDRKSMAAQLQASQEARISDLKEIVNGSRNSPS